MTDMSSTLEHYLLIIVFLFLGSWVVVAYAWQRFNEPSFPNQQTLPRTVDPLRYLFLKPAYQKARFMYVAGLLALYAISWLPVHRFSRQWVLQVFRDSHRRLGVCWLLFF